MENKNIDRNDEIDLRDLYSSILKRKLLIASSSFLFALIALLISLFFLPDIYKSEALLFPADNSQSNNMLSQYSGIASIAGISMPSQKGDKTSEAIERIKSYEFFSKYFLKAIQLQDLMAISRWDSSSNKIIYDKKLFNSKSRKWTSKEVIPSTQEAYKTYREIMSASQNDKSRFILISIKHQSPNLAKEWTGKIIQLINESMRDADKNKSLKSLEFLNNEASKVTYEHLRKAVSVLQQEQMKSLMLVEANEEYVFKIINSPIAPELKYGPKRLILIIASAFFGFVLGVMYVLIEKYARKDYKPS